MGNSTNDKILQVPLWAGWMVNILGWILFISTSNHFLEIITALLCVGCVYLAYLHKQAGTGPIFNSSYLSANNLIYTSAFEAIWMFLFGFGIIG